MIKWLTILLLAIAFMGCNSKGRKMPSLRETYNYKDAIPFGAKVAYRMLDNAYPDHFIDVQTKSITNSYLGSYSSKPLYISISNRLLLNEAEAKAIYELVENGATALLSSNYIDTTLLKRIGISQKPQTFAMFSAMSDTEVSLDSNYFGYPGNYSYYYYPLDGNFFGQDSMLPMGDLTHIDYNSDANSVIVAVGSGHFILNATPKVFSNYFLLTSQNHKLFNEIINLLPANPDNIYWDDFYSKRTSKSDDEDSMLSVLRKAPPLYKAFMLALAMLAIYILFGGKRKQRVIPQLPAVKNTSVKFAEAIGGLYRREEDNKLIAEKIISHFNEHIRSKYFISGKETNDDFIETVSRKSSNDIEFTRKLFSSFSAIAQAPEISDKTLMELNRAIEHFNKIKS